MKIINILWIILFVFALAACGGSKSEETEKEVAELEAKVERLEQEKAALAEQKSEAETAKATAKAEVIEIKVQLEAIEKQKAAAAQAEALEEEKVQAEVEVETEEPEEDEVEVETETERQGIHLAAVVPDTTLVYIEIPNLPKMIEAVEKTGPARLLREPEVAVSFAPTMKEFRQEWARTNQEFKERLGLNVEDLVDLFRGSVSVAVVDLEYRSVDEELFHELPREEPQKALPHIEIEKAAPPPREKASVAGGNLKDREANKKLVPIVVATAYLGDRIDAFRSMVEAGESKPEMKVQRVSLGEHDAWELGGFGREQLYVAFMRQMCLWPIIARGYRRSWKASDRKHRFLRVCLRTRPRSYAKVSVCWKHLSSPIRS